MLGTRFNKFLFGPKIGKIDKGMMLGLFENLAWTQSLTDSGSEFLVF